MHYATVFDISQTRFEWAYPSYGLLFCVAGLFLALVVGRWSKRKSPRVIGWFMAIFAIGWTAVALRSTWRDYHECLDALRSGGGNRREAAERLGISARTLRYKLARLREAGIDVPTA